MANLVLGEGVTSLGERAFADTAIESLVVPNIPVGKDCFAWVKASALSAAADAPDDLVAALAEMTGAPWYSPILREGEAAFRDAEEAAVLRAVRVPGAVIAVGGGTVIRENNRRRMRQYGRVYRLERPLEALDTRDRPLSQGPGALERLKKEREGFYAAVSDVTVEGFADIGEAAERILEEFDAYPGDQRA